MLSFADSINSKYNRGKHSNLYEFDSCGNFTNIGGEFFFLNEYDEFGRILRRIELKDNLPQDTVSSLYDETGHLVKKKYQNRMSEMKYDLEGNLSEYTFKDIENDSILIFEKYEYDKKGTLRKSECYGERERLGCSRGYCEYDSRGNIVYERKYDWGLSVPLFERKTKYKYDKNDSIVKQTCRELKWVNEGKMRDTIWQERDSVGQVVSKSGYTWAYSKTKRKSKSVKTISRNANGYASEEILMTFKNGERNPCSITKKRYDELGRMIVEEHSGDSCPGPYKKICKYYKDTDKWSYYAAFFGESYDFDHESMFFYDEKGNCIAHVQWMPKSSNSEYYFEVYKIGYYE